MADIKITNYYSSKRALTLLDCCDGDIVTIPHEKVVVGIVVNVDCDDSYVSVADLDTGDIFYFSETTPCRRYTEALVFDKKYFEEFCE